MTDTATDVYSSFTVTDLESTRAFYHGVLGLQVEDRDGMLTIYLPGGASTVAYAHPNHQPARFTILNIVVPDLPSAVADLTSPDEAWISSATRELPCRPTRTGSTAPAAPGSPGSPTPPATFLPCANATSARTARRVPAERRRVVHRALPLACAQTAKAAVSS